MLREILQNTLCYGRSNEETRESNDSIENARKANEHGTKKYDNMRESNEKITIHENRMKQI